MFRRVSTGDDTLLFCALYLHMAEMIYLDYNATTPLDPRILEAMLPFFQNEFGNASSKTNRFGWYASEAIEKAREQVAPLLSCEPQEILFTSGATESINLALKGIAKSYTSKGKHIVTVVTEHKAVLEVCDELEKDGFEVTRMLVNREGIIDLDQLKNVLRDDTILVAVMLANNETGTVQDIRAIADIVHAKGTILFCDTTQAVGKMRVDVNELGIDCCCVSAHKFGGPKGVGALFVRRKNPRVALYPLIHGGGQEKGLRGGTLNVPGIVGMGQAAEIASFEYWDVATRLSAWRTKMEQFITEDDRGFVSGCVKNRLCNTSNIILKNIRAEKLIAKLPLLAFATGSACTSAIDGPSHVLLAMGLSEQEAKSSIRISLGAATKEEEVLRARQEIRDAVDALQLSSQ